LYNSILPELAAIKVLNENRKRTLRQRWNENPDQQTLDFWERFFNYVRTIPFLMGENDRNWQPNFDWLIKSNNFIKVIEGYYERQQQ
jgi:hypothetical protein